MILVGAFLFVTDVATDFGYTVCSIVKLIIMKHPINHIFSILFILVLSLGLSLSLVACSNNSEVGAVSGISNKKAVLHTHLANKCIDAVSHSHSNGKKDHLHHYHSCEANGINSNAHSHPSSSITGFTRHVHPNGANEHTHSR